MTLIETVEDAEALAPSDADNLAFLTQTTLSVDDTAAEPVRVEAGSLALLFALTSNDIISYITKMISMIMSGMFICTMLGRFWIRFNWQGAVAALAGGAGASVVVLMDSDWLAFWGNPCIPSVLTSLVASVLVTLVTPASSMACPRMSVNSRPM